MEENSKMWSSLETHIIHARQPNTKSFRGLWIHLPDSDMPSRDDLQTLFKLSKLLNNISVSCHNIYSLDAVPRFTCSRLTRNVVLTHILKAAVRFANYRKQFSSMQIRFNLTDYTQMISLTICPGQFAMSFMWLFVLYHFTRANTVIWFVCHNNICNPVL